MLVEMDENAKVGSEVIEDDPNDISGNGKLLLELVKKQNLRILNYSPTVLSYQFSEQSQE